MRRAFMVTGSLVAAGVLVFAALSVLHGQTASAAEAFVPNQDNCVYNAALCQLAQMNASSTAVGISLSGKAAATSATTVQTPSPNQAAPASAAAQPVLPPATDTATTGAASASSSTPAPASNSSTTANDSESSTNDVFKMFVPTAPAPIHSGKRGKRYEN